MVWVGEGTGTMSVERKRGRKRKQRKKGREVEEICRTIIQLRPSEPFISSRSSRGREAGVQSYHAVCECWHAAEMSRSLH